MPPERGGGENRFHLLHLPRTGTTWRFCVASNFHEVNTHEYTLIVLQTYPKRYIALYQNIRAFWIKVSIQVVLISRNTRRQARRRLCFPAREFSPRVLGRPPKHRLCPYHTHGTAVDCVVRGTLRDVLIAPSSSEALSYVCEFSRFRYVRSSIAENPKAPVSYKMPYIGRPVNVTPVYGIIQRRRAIYSFENSFGPSIFGKFPSPRPLLCPS